MSGDNNRFKELLGFRRQGGISVTSPSDFNYVCPQCQNKNLDWSEFNGCLWCENCQLDIPSCLCADVLSEQIKIFLTTLEECKQ